MFTTEQCLVLAAGHFFEEASRTRQQIITRAEDLILVILILEHERTVNLAGTKNVSRSE